MDEENESKIYVKGGTGITAGRDTQIGDISGTFTIANNSKVHSINESDLKELRENLLELRKGINELGLEPEDRDIVSANINSAIKEAEKEEPQPSKIQGRFESVIKTINDAGKAISSISGLYEPAKKIAKILGIATSLL